MEHLLSRSGQGRSHRTEMRSARDLTTAAQDEASPPNTCDTTMAIAAFGCS